MADWGVALCGPVTLRGPDGPVESGSALLRTTLALLAHEPGANVATSTLVDELWGEALPNDPRASLQVHMTRLRKWVTAAGGEPDAVVNEYDGYRLAVGGLGVDLDAFRRAAALALAPGVDPSSVLERTAAALELWTGEPFGGCVAGFVLEAAAVRATEAHLQVLETRAAALLELGRSAEAAAGLQPVLVRNRSRERLTVLVADALDRAGRQRDALAELDATRRHLRELYGLDPGAELAAMEVRILRPGSAAPAERSAAPAATDPGVGRGRRRPRMAGRDAELSVAAAAPLLIAGGEAGAGKSTFLAAALHEAASAGASTGLGAADGGPTPLACWAAALAELGVDLPAAVAAQRDAPVAPLVRRLLGERARLGEVVVALDDVHLADTSSLAVLRGLVPLGLPPGARLLLAARDPDTEARPAWLATHADLARAGAAEVVLGPLDRMAAEEVIADRLPAQEAGAGPDPALTALLWERSGGQPLHLAALLDVAAAQPDDASRAAAVTRLPDRLRPLLRHQLEALDAPARELVEILAVVGATAVEPLGRWRELEPLATLAALRPAFALGLVVDDGVRLTLRHDLTRQAALDAMPAAARHVIHDTRRRQLVDSAGDPLEVVRHAVGAGPLAPPADLAVARLEAGRVLLARGAPDDAVAMLGAAIGDIPADRRLELDTHLGLALLAVGKVEEADDLLDGAMHDPTAPPELLALAAVGDEPLGLRVAGDERRLRRLVHARAATIDWPRATRMELLRALLIEESLLFGAVRTEAAVSELEELAAAAGADPVHVARMATVRTRELVEAPVRAAERLADARATASLVDAVGDPVWRLQAAELLMSAALAAGRLDEVDDTRWAISRAADRVHRPRSRWAVQLVDAALAAAAGRGEESDRVAEAALELGLGLGIPDAMGAYGVHLVGRRLLSGSLAEVVGLVEGATTTYPNIAAWRAGLAVAHLHAGDRDAASVALDEWRRVRDAAPAHYFDRTGLALAALAACQLRDTDAAAVVRGALPADAEAVVVVGVGAAVYGPVDLWVALADLALDDPEAAAHHLAGAAALAAARGWEPWRAACEHATAVLVEGAARPRSPQGQPLGLVDC